MRVRALPLAAAAALVTLALPSHAATGSRALFFANAGSASTSSCTPDYVLAKAPSGEPCSSVRAGVAGNGLLGSDTFSSVKKAVGFRLSTKKPLTGVLYVATYPLFSGTPVNTLPGPVDVTVTVSVNGVELDPVQGSGQAVAPNSDVVVPLSISLPAKLDRAVVKTVEVDVAFDTAAGIVGVDYSPAHASKLVLPTA